MATFTVPGLGAELPLEIAESGPARRRGLLGRDGVNGALLLTSSSSVHTVGMRFVMDVAYLDRRGTVLAVRTMRPGRIGLPDCAPGASWSPRRGRWRGGGYGGACG